MSQSANITLTRTKAALAPSRVVGAVGGLSFVVIVILQNALRGSSMPANDAAAHAVSVFYSNHRATSALLVALFAISALGLAAFTGALIDSVRSRHARAPLFAGVLGVTGIVALFTMTVAVDVTLSTYVHRGAPSPDVISALWILHGAVFALLQATIGIALIGLTAACTADGLIGVAWKPVGLIAGLCLLVSAGAAPAITEGSNVIAIGFVGFAVWLAFVARAAVALLKRGATPDA